MCKDLRAEVFRLLLRRKVKQLEWVEALGISLTEECRAIYIAIEKGDCARLNYRAMLWLWKIGFGLSYFLENNSWLLLNIIEKDNVQCLRWLWKRGLTVKHLQMHENIAFYHALTFCSMKILLWMKEIGFVVTVEGAGGVARSSPFFGKMLRLSERA